MASKKVTTSSRTTDSIWFDDTGTDLMFKDIEKAFGRDAAKVYDSALDEAFATPEAVLRDWFKDVHYRTGRTAKAYVPGKTMATFDRDIEGYAYYRIYGYDKKKSCVPIFFEYGTPRSPPYRIKPEFIIYYVKKDFKGQMPEALVEALREEFRKRQEASARASAGASQGGVQA